MSENVQVAVRVRPFNEREKSMKATCCIRMLPETQQTIITDPETSQDKSFTFDFSYNSFVDASSPEFASQDTVWDDLGIKVLEHAWQGFNVSLFAYGQTGAGKSFSMVGYGPEKGIIPRASEVIFQRIEQNTSEITFKVEASMMEIYNEKVKDLFNPSCDNLRVRDHPKTGPYADGLTRSAVSSYSEINRLMEAGIMARTTAATNMNATSSRAHTIFQVQLTQSEVDPSTKKMTDKVSRISLIDLAGSERASSTGATKGRLKEGAAINQSLSSLGNCIKALADNANGKKTLVPYRNSKLTHLLKDSLGGNAKTIMIAALSPASVNYGETLGTLRYADRAKQIKNQAVINEDPNQKLIRMLKEELLSLKKQMVDTQTGSTPDVLAAARTEVPDEEKAREVAKIKEQLEENQRLLAESQKSWNDRLKETEELAKKREEQLKSIGLGGNFTDVKKKAMEEPHLLNLNEDQLMSEKLFYFLNIGLTRIGREDAQVPQDVIVGGLGILKEHCTIEHLPSEDGKQDMLTIVARPEAKVFVNGQVLESGIPRILTHCDRVIFGHSNVFRLCIPSHQDLEERANDSKYDWQYAMKEMNSKQMHIIASSASLTEEAEKERVEMEDRIRQMQERMAQEQAVAEEKALRQKQEWEQHVESLKKEMEKQEKELKDKDSGSSAEIVATSIAEREAQLAEDLARAELDYEERQKSMLIKQQELEENLEKQVLETRKLAARKQREREERALLDEQLLHEIPIVNEANSMSEEMSKGVGFVLKMVGSKPHLSVLGNRAADVFAISESISCHIKVQVSFQENGLLRTEMWDIDKFDNRIYTMREMYQTFIEQGRSYEAIQWGQDDPFCDVPEPQLIGTSYLFIDSLVYCLQIQEKIPIFDHKGTPSGTIKIDVRPTVKTNDFHGELPYKGEGIGKGGDINSIELPSIREYIGGYLRLEITIQMIENIPSKLCKDVFLAFKWNDLPDTYISQVSQQTSINHKMGFKTKIEARIDEQLLFYLENSAMDFQVYGNTPSSCSTLAPEQVLSRAAESTRDLEGEDEEDSKLKRKRKKEEILKLEKTVESQKEQLVLQENTLMENTEELESSLHQVQELTDTLDGERKRRLELEKQVKRMNRQNEILKEKIKKSALEPSRKKTAIVINPPEPETVSEHIDTSNHKKQCIIS